MIDLSDARVKFEWSQTASVLCLIANVNRDPKKTKAFKPSDFFDFGPAKDRKAEAIQELTDFSIIKDAFVN